MPIQNEKTIKVSYNTHLALIVLKAKHGFKSLDKTIVYLMDVHKP